QGRAYLFDRVVNDHHGPVEEAVLPHWTHSVRIFTVAKLRHNTSWTCYEHAFESSQKYKEGKFIIGTGPSD
uniref:Yippee domain-containing protein n=1 Tax=Macrostomum lignano TaxID=282301 RepID=A0A1I8JRN6_9PLAT